SPPYRGGQPRGSSLLGLPLHCSSRRELIARSFEMRWTVPVSRNGRYGIFGVASFGLRAGELHNLAPLFGFLSDELAEVGNALTFQALHGINFGLRFGGTKLGNASYECSDCEYRRGCSGPAERAREGRRHTCPQPTGCPQ